MTPLVVRLVELLLEKGETVKMTSSFHGNTVDVIVKSIERIDSALASSYYFKCEFYDELIDEVQTTDERRSEDELELMTLKKLRDFWALY